MFCQSAPDTSVFPFSWILDWTGWLLWGSTVTLLVEKVLCHWLVMWPLKIYFTFLSLSFTVYKVGMKCVLVAQSCPTLWDPMNCSQQGSSVHGIPQAWILKWAAMPSPRGSSWSGDWTWISCIADGFFTIWATREELFHLKNLEQNDKQGEKTALRLGENNSKRSSRQRINLKNIQATPPAQLQKNKWPSQKMGQRTKQTFLQGRHTDG